VRERYGVRYDGRMSDRFALHGRIALVTGASSGLGRHFATTLARAGAAVAVAARRRAPLETLVADIAREGGRAVAVEMDVTDGDSVRAGCAVAAAALGTLDVVVNNAGISIVKPPLELSDADWDAVVDTNLRGAWLVARTAAQALVAAGRPGRIINIASIVGLRTIGHLAPYAAAKAGLLHLTHVLAMEWARYGIQVNAIAPGYVETDLNREFWSSAAGRRLIERIPQRRLGRLEDLDGPLLLLASDAGAFMTGSVLVVDGGHAVATL
jgi:NAD(P)-dependent dehydrogenase (short-subunit alcohol dehydrogenase family)